jgi:TolA-binding protein
VGRKVTVNRGSRGQTAAAAYAKPPANPITTILAIVGWVAAAVLVLALMNSVSAQDRVSKKLTADIAAKEKEAAQRIEAIRNSGDQEQKELRKKATILDSDYQTLSKQRKQLERAITTLEKRIPILERQAASTVATPVPAPVVAPEPVPADPPERKFDPLGPKLPVGAGPAPGFDPFGTKRVVVRPAQPATPPPGNPAQSAVNNVAAELSSAVADAKVKELVATRDSLENLYADRLELLKLKINTVIADGRGPQIHAFYRKAAHTPYGAAALFFAGEKYYRDGKLTQAAGAYKNLRERFPGSPYSDLVDERIDQVLDKDLYTKIDAEIQPYVK